MYFNHYFYTFLISFLAYVFTISCTKAQTHDIVITPSENLKELIEKASDNSLIHIKSGKYFAENIILLNKHSITITADTGTLIIKQHFDCNDLIEVLQCSDINISGLALLYATKLENTTKVNCGRGIKVLNSENITISNNTIANTYEHAIAVYGDYLGFETFSRNITIKNNIVNKPGNLFNKRGWGIWIYKNVENVTISNNSISDFISGGIFVDDEHAKKVPHFTFVKDIVIQNNKITNHNLYKHCSVGIGGAGAKNVTIKNNEIEMINVCSEAISFSEGQAGAGVYKLNIENNTYNTKRYGIHLNGNVNAVKISGNKDLMINKKKRSGYKEYYFDKVNEKEITIK
jgi:parallel beta-helix repeat protein